MTTFLIPETKGLSLEEINDEYHFFPSVSFPQPPLPLSFLLSTLTFKRVEANKPREQQATPVDQSGPPAA